jgi:ferredoxin-type protein NapH
MNENAIVKSPFISGKKLLIFSVFTRTCVLMLLCLFALWTEYINLKTAYNNARLVELSAGSDSPRYGKVLRAFYENSEAFFSLFGDPVEVMQSNGGMTWFTRIMGVPFTDPVAGLSFFSQNFYLPAGFALGMLIPLLLALIFGRVFCAYICPASLLFFTIARLRKFLGKWLLLPDIQLNRGVAWGVLLGGLIMAAISSYGVWILLLPYFAIGQTIFHGLAFGVLSMTYIVILIFAFIDLCVGQQFTCRYLCPTGRLLGTVGQRALISIRRDESRCVKSCNACTAICPMKADPKIDQQLDCSLCGECISVCPSQCLYVGIKKK